MMISDSLIVVTGQPRSGTSLMMRILEKSGVAVIADERRSYECSLLSTLKTDNMWVLDLPLGWAIKILFPTVANIPVEHPYTMIWMHRKASDTAKSQRRFATKHRSWEPAQEKLIRKVNQSAPTLFANQGAEVLEVSFDALIRKKNLGSVEDFLGLPLDPSPIVDRNPRFDPKRPPGLLETVGELPLGASA